MTQRSDNVKGSPKGRELDRTQWADYQRIVYDTLVLGTGEHLTPIPIAFGRAFSHPPVFSHSVSMPVASGVLPALTVPPRGAGAIDVDVRGLSASSMAPGQVIWDSGFESQGQYIAELGAVARKIPSVNELNDGLYPSSATPITNAWNYGASDYPREPEDGTNGWLQTDDSRGFWELSDTESDDFGLGARGKWSAKFEFELDGASELLIPWDNAFTWWVASSEATRGPWDLYGTPSVSIGGPYSGYWDYLGFSYSAPPPYMSGWDGHASAYSTQPCTFKVDAINFHWEGGTVEPQLDIESPENSIAPWYREIERLTFTQEVVPDTWNHFVVDLPSTISDRYLTNWPPVGYPKSKYGDDPNQLGTYWRFEYSIEGGVAGQVAYLDNLYLYNKMKNAVPPIITIGVAEWVVDEAGAYIGAYMWFKIGSPENRTLGTADGEPVE